MNLENLLAPPLNISHGAFKTIILWEKFQRFSHKTISTIFRAIFALKHKWFRDDCNDLLLIIHFFVCISFKKKL